MASDRCPIPFDPAGGQRIPSRMGSRPRGIPDTLPSVLTRPSAARSRRPDRGRGRPSFGRTPLGRDVGDIGPDGVGFGEPAQVPGSDPTATAVVDPAKAPPGVRPAICWLQRRNALAVPSGQPTAAGVAREVALAPPSGSPFEPLMFGNLF